MVQQAYNLYTQNAYKGQKSYASEHSVNVSAAVEDAELDYGVSVQPGTEPNQVVKGTVAGNVFGIALREDNHEAKFRPSTGETTYVETETASIMRQGTINLEVTVRPVVAHTLMNVVELTGEFTGGAAGAGETATLNVVALEDGLVGDIIKARIDIIA